MSLKDSIDFFQIYPGDKKTHFVRFQKQCGAKYEEMLFFDNEMRNCESVSDLGVRSIYSPEGLTQEIWDKSINEFSNNAR
jgi:magnesium-dependent phosphatase 1